VAEVDTEATVQVRGEAVIRVEPDEAVLWIALTAIEDSPAPALAARIDGPRWQIAAGNPVRLEAAREAARDAERKARAYAEGLGVRLGRPLRLVEPGDRPVMIRAAARSAGPESLPIDPGEQEVSAAIEVTFALEPGGGA
jgi:uncharacterized protein YggE